MNKKILIAMSGGVDSSVAAYLIQQTGAECMGGTMKLYGKCFSKTDADDAKAVCDRLGFDHTLLDLTDDFERKVIRHFADTYIAGATPNPCIECNRHIKFGALLKHARALGFEYVATGHYARIEQQNGRFVLKKGLDESKDQSYVLYSLTQDELAHTLLPLGGLSKSQVRELAHNCSFESANKKESQDICFVPDGDYASFIERYTGKSFKQGDFVDLEGNIVGRHNGIIRYTIGQRKGLGIAAPRPLFVHSKDVDKNRVVLCHAEDMFGTECTLCDFNWIVPHMGEFFAKVKPRYRAKEADARVIPLDDTHVKIVFDTPQRALAKGQAAVVYDGDTVVGGGTIE